MSEHEYGPMRTWEITWTDGRVEHASGHQILTPGPEYSLMSAYLGTGSGMTVRRRWMIHASIDGVWSLVFSAPDADIHTVRDVTASTGGDTEPEGSAP